LHHAWHVIMNRPSCDLKKRGLAGQQPRRLVERDARSRAVALGRWLRGRGHGLATAAARLGLAPRTLAHWDRRWQVDGLCVRGRGRPCRRSDRETRNAAIELMATTGPSIGVPTLRAAFRTMARGELVDLKRRWRRVLRKRYKGSVYRLEWPRAGAVWAMDHAEPPHPVDGEYPYLLAVRDLASGCQLAWLPQREANAAGTSDALRALFVEHGPPLVIKSDNGPPFIAELTEQTLTAREVTHLFSPPYTPEYNGACEAGIGGLKNRTHEEAAAAGLPGFWTSDDVEAARLRGNELLRPAGHHAATPDELWRDRRPIEARERAAFLDALARHRSDIRSERGYTSDEELPRAVRSSLDRVAIRRALVEHGILQFRRSITPSLNV
jgi:transposase InsO family protein